MSRRPAAIRAGVLTAAFLCATAGRAEDVHTPSRQHPLVLGAVGTVVGGGLAMFTFMFHDVSAKPNSGIYFVASYFVGATLGTVVGVSAADRVDHFHGNSRGRLAGAAAGVLGGMGLMWSMKVGDAISEYTIAPLMAAEWTLPAALAVMGDRR
jgi:hypothetical protein